MRGSAQECPARKGAVMNTRTEPVICWVMVKHLSPNDLVAVSTRNTRYAIKMANPENGAASINSDGDRITAETPCTIFGTQTGDGEIKKDAITIGHHLYIHLREDKTLRILPEEIRVNGTKLLP